MKEYSVSVLRYSCCKVYSVRQASAVCYLDYSLKSKCFLAIEMLIFEKAYSFSNVYHKIRGRFAFRKRAVFVPFQKLEGGALASLAPLVRSRLQAIHFLFLERIFGVKFSLMRDLKGNALLVAKVIISYFPRTAQVYYVLLVGTTSTYRGNLEV